MKKFLLCILFIFLFVPNSFAINYKHWYVKDFFTRTVYVIVPDDVSSVSMRWTASEVYSSKACITGKFRVLEYVPAHDWSQERSIKKKAEAKFGREATQIAIEGSNEDKYNWEGKLPSVYKFERLVFAEQFHYKLYYNDGITLTSWQPQSNYCTDLVDQKSRD